MEKQITITIVIATVMFAAVSGAPHRKPRSVPVQSAQGNKTLCPYQVEVDEDPDRVPKRIKVIKCLHTASQQLEVARHHHKHKCEDLTTHTKERGRCVELHDEVLVFYKRERATRTYDVPVGCTCMFQEHENAIDPKDTVPSPS